ncbi:MAG: hypothetical protein ACOZJZ_25385 [Pseudomonadota bacterium]
MAITMQGAWTIRVSAKNASFAQRFVVTGADSGNGTYTGTVGTSVFVSGAQWSLNIQHQPTGQPWRDSAQRIGFPGVAGGLLRFEIRSNDAGADTDYDDLVLSCSLPASASDYVLYGTVKTYAGLCLFNPCRDDYVVLDPPYHLQRLCERFPQLCDVLAKLYPERLRVPPIPLPDPPPELTPIVIPTGLPVVSNGLVFQSRMARAPQAGAKLADDQREAEAVAALGLNVRRTAFRSSAMAAGLDKLSRLDLEAIAGIRDIGIRFRCNVERAPGLLLRFQEYDRTAAEKLGGPYSGAGARQDLGLAVTDELGNYIFRFSPSLADIAEETADVAAGESLAAQLRPDVIVQVVGTGLTATYETAPYNNVANLQRIDLCVPYDKAHPSRACAGDRVIQRVGDIVLLHSAIDGTPNQLDAEGRITCRNANAPQVDCAGWRGALRLYACFGRPEAVRYAVFHKRPSETTWHAVNEPHALNWIPNLVAGGTSVGPSDQMVTPSVPLAGGPGQPVPTYANHEGDLNWIENDLKLILHTALYRPWDEPGPVQFHIEAYDSAGNAIAATADTVTLYIHNRTAIAGRPQKGDIESITMGSTTLGDCGLFVLSAPDAPLTVKHRAVDPEGFLHSWSLSVTRGNHHPVSTVVVGGVTPKAFNAAATPCDFTGTRDEPTADVNDYVLTELKPNPLGADGPHWLPAGHNFCAFAFTLSASDRVTDGRTAYPQVVFWQDLIGLSTGA